MGNHDVDAGRQDQCQYPLFNMGGAPYYKLERGDGLTEFFMLDSNDFDQRQAAWLENSLRDSKAEMENPSFPSSHLFIRKNARLKRQLGETTGTLFIRYGVNVTLSGHDHIYERTKPQHGVQYFVSGAGGKVRRGNVDRGSGLSAASFEDDNHFMVFEIEDSQAHFQAISGTGVVVDSGSFTCA